jgi:hypothetical protein
MVGRVDYLDAPGQRLILSGMVFTLAPSVKLTGLTEGAMARISYAETRDCRVACTVDQIGGQRRNEP